MRTILGYRISGLHKHYLHEPLAALVKLSRGSGEVCMLRHSKLVGTPKQTTNDQKLHAAKLNGTNCAFIGIERIVEISLLPTRLSPVMWALNRMTEVRWTETQSGVPLRTNRNRWERDKVVNLITKLINASRLWTRMEKRRNVDDHRIGNTDWKQISGCNKLARSPTLIRMQATGGMDTRLKSTMESGPLALWPLLELEEGGREDDAKFPQAI